LVSNAKEEAGSFYALGPTTLARAEVIDDGGLTASLFSVANIN
jgi:hypothetical protein